MKNDFGRERGAFVDFSAFAMPNYQACWGGTIADEGLDTVVVARMRGPGNVEIGVFLVDAWCLGVKDAFFLENASEDELREMIVERFPDGAKTLDPACAKQLIEGAARYAEGLGFASARDFRKARRVLGGIDASACRENYTFGFDGRPRFVAGPNDSPERIQRVLGILRARCGNDGFDYILPEKMPEEDDAADDDAMLDPAEIEQQVAEDTADYLREVLDAQAPPAPSFRELCGVLGAEAAGPDSGSSIQAVCEAIADRCGPELHAEERKDFTSAVGLQLLRTMADFIAANEAPASEANPIQLVDVEPDDKADGASFVIEWCRGFLRATELWPETWRDPLGRDDLAPHFALIRAWAYPDKDDNAEFIRRESAAGRQIHHAAMALFRALRLKGGTRP